MRTKKLLKLSSILRKFVYSLQILFTNKRTKHLCIKPFNGGPRSAYGLRYIPNGIRDVDLGRSFVLFLLIGYNLNCCRFVLFVFLLLFPTQKISKLLRDKRNNIILLEHIYRATDKSAMIFEKKNTHTK